MYAYTCTWIINWLIIIFIKPSTVIWSNYIGTYIIVRTRFWWFNLWLIFNDLCATEKIYVICKFHETIMNERKLGQMELFQILLKITCQAYRKSYLAIFPQFTYNIYQKCNKVNLEFISGHYLPNFWTWKIDQKCNKVKFDFIWYLLSAYTIAHSIRGICTDTIH